MELHSIRIHRDEHATLDAVLRSMGMMVDQGLGKYPRDPACDRLFTRIVNRAPAPIGLDENG